MCFVKSKYKKKQLFIHYKYFAVLYKSFDSKIIGIDIITGNCTPFHVSNYEISHLISF